MMLRTLIFIGFLLSYGNPINGHDNSNRSEFADDWRAVYDSFDFDRNGSLNQFEFQQFLLTIFNKNSDTRIDPKHLSKLGNLLDFDGDSNIGREEFRKIYSNFWNVIMNLNVCYRLVISDDIVKRGSIGDLFYLTREYAVNSINQTLQDISFGTVVRSYVGPCMDGESFTYKDDLLLVLNQAFKNIHFLPSSEPIDSMCNIIVHSTDCGSRSSSYPFQPDLFIVNSPSDLSNTFEDYSEIIFNRSWAQKEYETQKVVLKIALSFARHLHRKYYNNAHFPTEASQ